MVVVIVSVACMWRGLMAGLRRHVLAVTAGLGILAAASPALADPPCGRGWRKGEYCGPYAHARPPRAYRAPPPFYVGPPPPRVYDAPPVVVAPPPVIYAPPPAVVLPRPSIGLHIDIPLIR
jgi:hypothetical protein